MLFKKRTLADQQINVWFAWHCHDSVYGGFYLVEYERYVRQFIRFTHKGDFRDVDESDVERYLHHIRQSQNGSLPALKAEKAIGSVLKFYQARGKKVEKFHAT